LLDQIDSYPSTLSFGMRKRLEFARAIYAQPSLLLADEPFSSLDALTRETIHSLFAREVRRRNITTLFVTHDLTEAIFLADKVVVLTGGPNTTTKQILSVPFPPENRSTDILFDKQFRILHERLHEELRI
jgi:ABC-type nitrate/sulfonate/bicarbonate transport system ATPase subunit